MSTRSTAPEPVVIVGRGRLGAALARALRGAGWTVSLLPGRAPPARALAAARLVVIAVPDPAIAAVGRGIARSIGAGAIVLHVAGGAGPELLAACRAAGASVGAMHPLASFASRRRAPPLAGTTFVVDGDPPAVRAASRIARALGARSLVRALHGPAYHAAAALLANGAAALAAVAVDTLVALGASRREAERASGALLATVAANVTAEGLPGALTGPIVRGDAASVARHRAALSRADRGALAAYDALAPSILEVARRAGLAPAAAREVQRALAAPAVSLSAPRGAPRSRSARRRR